MKSYKAQVINDEWLRQLSGSQDANISKTDTAYTKIPLIYRAVRLRCDSLVSIPIHVYEGDNEIENWPYSTSLKHIIWQTEASHLLKGGSVWLKLRNKYNLDKGIQVLNPFTVNITYDYRFRERQFEQYIQGVKYGPWSESEVVFWREYSPLDDIAWGTAAAEVALGDSQIMHYLSRFQREFFKSGAQPATLIGLEDATQVETERIQNWFEKSISGVQRAWRVMAIRGKITPQVLTPTFKDMALPEVRTQAFSAIVQAFGIPETMLMGNQANYATAQADAMSYVSKTLGPRAVYYQDGLNNFLEPTGIRVEFAVEEMSEMQEDETQRSQAYSGYVSAGMPEEVARAVLGIDIPPDVQEIWDKYLARKEERQNAPPVQAPPVPAPPVEAPANQLQDQQGGKALELDKWKRKALKRLEEGKSPAVDFISSQIPVELSESIKSKLVTAETREEVLQAFPLQAFHEDIAIYREPEMKLNINLGGNEIGEELGKRLGEKIGEAMKGVKFETQPIIVNVPEQSPPIVNITVPQQAAPVVNFTPSAQPITVNVPEQKAPEVKVDVHVPDRKKMKIARDTQGRIKEIE